MSNALVHVHLLNLVIPYANDRALLKENAPHNIWESNAVVPISKISLEKIMFEKLIKLLGFIIIKY